MQYARPSSRRVVTSKSRSLLGRALALVLGLALLGLCAPTAAQGLQPHSFDESESAAHDADEAGRIAYQHGRFAEALARFELAYELNPHPELLFNVARAAAQDGRIERAIEAYSAYQQAMPDSDKHDFVEARLAKLRAQQERVVLAPAPEPTRDEARVPSPRVTATRAVQAEAPSPAHTDDAPAPKRFWQRGWFWGAVVVVVAGAVTGGLLVARANSGTDMRSDLRYQTLEAR